MPCANPRTFTFGGMFAHGLPFNPVPAMVATDVLRGLSEGLRVFGGPMQYLKGPGECVETREYEGLLAGSSAGVPIREDHAPTR